MGTATTSETLPRRMDYLPPTNPWVRVGSGERTYDDGRVFAHLQERLASRYGVNLDWPAFDALHRAAQTSCLRLDCPTKVPGNELRFFHWDGVPMLGWFRVQTKRVITVLPYEDYRWRLVPLELRPREAVARTLRFSDQNWLPVASRTPQAEVTPASPTPDARDRERLRVLEEAVAWAFVRNIGAGAGMDEAMHEVLRRVILEP